MPKDPKGEKRPTERDSSPLFLLRWVEENVQAVAFPENRKEGESLAKRCLADASDAGINEADLEKAAGGDLISYMFDALKEAATREMDRLIDKG
jgi:hypothetical protein